jgi:hypothetical protein
MRSCNLREKNSPEVQQLQGEEADLRSCGPRDKRLT